MLLKNYYWVIFLLVFMLSACQSKRLEINQLRSISKLVALEVHTEKVIIAKGEKRLFPMLMGGIKLNKATFIGYAQPVIEIGVDLKKMEEDDLNYIGEAIQVKLPPIEVLVADLREETIVEDHFYLSKNRFRSKDLGEVYKAVQKELNEFMIYTELEEKAKGKIDFLLRAFLTEMGYKKVHIEFKEKEQEESITSLENPINHRK